MTNNYNGLQMHLLTMMQQQNDQSGEETNKNGLVPRQFMDLGFGGNEEGSLSPPEGRNVTPTHDKDVVGRDEQCSDSKVQKLGHSPRSVDQATEATMRKARVSVRARSEATMVSRDEIIGSVICVNFFFRVRCLDFAPINLKGFLYIDHGWMPMAEVWTEVG